jgi:hypothetical protein
VSATDQRTSAAAVQTTGATRHQGVTRLRRRALRWRVGIGWWLLVLAGLPVLGTGFALLFGDTLVPVDPVGLVVGQLRFVVVNFLVINLWEEMAWSGVFQTRLERRHNLFLVALLGAVAFATIHLPLQFFLGGEVGAASDDGGPHPDRAPETCRPHRQMHTPRAGVVRGPATPTGARLARTHSPVSDERKRSQGSRPWQASTQHRGRCRRIVPSPSPSPSFSSLSRSPGRSGRWRCSMSVV